MSVEAKQQVPSIGRIVHYVMATGANKGDHRPAIIVNVITTSRIYVQLQVFTDSLYDGKEFVDGIYHASDVLHDPTGTIPHSYHFPEYVPSV